MSEVVPEGWKKDNLGEVSTIIMGQSPLSNTYNGEGVGLPFFQGKTDFGTHYPVVRIWCSEPTKVAPEESILFSVRAPVGDVNIAPKECCIGRGLAALIGDKVDQSFLYQSLISSKSRFRLLSQGSTFEAINGTEMREFCILTPPLPEQQKIASILTSVDEVIEKTEAQISKLQDLKKGMMQELLTKGIGHTEFKDSPVGRIPKEWEVVDLLSASIKVKRGPSLSCNTEGRGIRYVTSGSLQDGKLDLNIDLKYLDSFDKIGTCLLVDGDLVMNCVNSAAKIGGTGIYKESYGKAIIGFNNYAIELKRDIFISGFVNHYSKLDIFRFQIQSITKPAINQVSFATKDLKKLLLPVPPIEEQRQIHDVLESIDNNIDSKHNRLSQFRSSKKALMQDLLTGKVRVKTD